jgi:hypothetical protein
LSWFCTFSLYAENEHHLEVAIIEAPTAASSRAPRRPRPPHRRQALADSPTRATCRRSPRSPPQRCTRHFFLARSHGGRQRDPASCPTLTRSTDPDGIGATSGFFAVLT